MVYTREQCDCAETYRGSECMKKHKIFGNRGASMVCSHCMLAAASPSVYSVLVRLSQCPLYPTEINS